MLFKWYSTDIQRNAQSELETALKTRGPIALSGIEEFTEAFESIVKPRKSTTAATIVSALIESKERSAQVDSLVRLAIAKQSIDEITFVTTTIETTGTFNRQEIYGGNSIEHAPSFRQFKFDEYNMDTAHKWWEALGLLIKAWYGSNARANNDEEVAEHNWKAVAKGGIFSQGKGEMIEDLIAREQSLHEAYNDTTPPGEDVCTPRQRIKNLYSASDQHIQSNLIERLDQKDMPLYYKLRWQEFLTELEKVGNYGNCNHSPGSTPLVATPTGSEECRDWKYKGTCAHSDRCKFAHTSAPGSPKVNKNHTPTSPDKTCKNHPGARNHPTHECYAATDKGVCYSYIRGTCTRGDDCNYDHDDSKFSDKDRRDAKDKLQQSQERNRARASAVVAATTAIADTARQGDDISNAPVGPCSWVEEESETFPRERLNFDY